MALKIIFMGTSEFAVPILKSIYESHHSVLEIYTQSPKKKDRGQRIDFSPIHKFSDKIKLKVRYPETLNSAEELKHITELKPDVVIVVAYGKILPSNFLNTNTIKFINIHASLLPKWRGAAPIHRAIMNLDQETGISIMRIVSKLDAGPVMMKSKIKISNGINYENLSKQMSKLGARMILESLNLLENKKANFINQNEKEATYAKKINKTESKINWNEKAKKIIAQINALYPNPGAWFRLNGYRIKVIKAEEVKVKGTPGEILSKDFTIACSENAVQIIELKKEGKKSMKSEEFLKGNKLEIGTNLIKNE